MTQSCKEHKCRSINEENHNDIHGSTESTGISFTGSNPELVRFVLVSSD